MAIESDGALAPFVQAVVAQLGRAPGAADASVAAERLRDLIRAAAADEVDVAAAQLLADPPLFAALFQNLDLLFLPAGPTDPAARDAHSAATATADALSAAVMLALQRASA